MRKPAQYPGYRTMSGVERRNARMFKIFDDARSRFAEDHLAKGHADYVALCPLCDQEQAEDRQIARALNVPLSHARTMGR